MNEIVKVIESLGGKEIQKYVSKNPEFENLSKELQKSEQDTTVIGEVEQCIYAKVDDSQEHKQGQIVFLNPEGETFYEDNGNISEKPPTKVEAVETT